MVDVDVDAQRPPGEAKPAEPSTRYTPSTPAMLSVSGGGDGGAGGDAGCVQRPQCRRQPAATPASAQ